MRILIVSLFGLVAACGAGSVRLPDQAYQDEPAGVRYVNAAGSSQIFFSRGVMYVGPTEREAQRLHRGGGEAHISGGAFRSCSDERFVCLAADRLVFAVPRAGLANGMTYAAQGVRFTIEDCHDAACSTADIRSLCERAEGNGCALSESGPSADALNLMTFTYSRAAGVTSISLLPHGPEQRLALVAGHGILSDDAPR